MQLGVTETLLMFLLISVIATTACYCCFIPVRSVKTWVLKTVACVFVDGMLVTVDMSYIL
jgi:hypothetical protein